MGDLERVPVICLDPSSVAAYSIFNPNDWHLPASRALVQSCASELASLRYATARLDVLARSGRELCRGAFQSLQQAWPGSSPEVERVACLAQVPELHLVTEGFLGGLKSLLDLMVQLLSTQHIVTARLDGFHRKKNVLGGRVLSALARNPVGEHSAVASLVRDLLLEHKARWIDDAIEARDTLIHPDGGAHQLMFEMVIRRDGAALVLVAARPPRFGTEPIHDYASHRLADVSELATHLLGAVRRAA